MKKAAIPFNLILLMLLGSCKKEECCDCPQTAPGTGGFQLEAITFCENGPAKNNDTLHYDYEWESFAALFGVNDWDEFVSLIDDDCDCQKK